MSEEEPPKPEEDEGGSDLELRAAVSDELPVWARPEAFSVADSGWGWVDRKGKRVSCKDFDDLSAAIIDDAGARVDLVWTPASDFLVLPEEVPSLYPALKGARIRWAIWEMGEGRKQMWIFGGFLLVFLIYSLVTRQELMAFGPMGLALLLFVMLGFIPWYQGRKRLARARKWQDMEGKWDVTELRFETWLLCQKAPLTKILLGMMAVVGLVQWLSPGELFDSIQAAGLTKLNHRVSDWWRLLTAPFLHGHWIHFLFNASALIYLGRRMEVLARWPHVVLVFLLSAWVGGEASARFVDNPSVGASGGLMGMLGFLLVFESLHPNLVPESARRRLLAGVVLTGVIGILGFRYIDNAAHAGGLLAGMVYALVMFPKTSSIRRPRETGADRLAGTAAFAVLVLSAGWACLKLWG